MSQVRKWLADGKEESLVLLKHAVKSLKDDLEEDREKNSEEAVSEKPDVSEEPSGVVASIDVFIIHGHDEMAKIEVARLIERAGLNAVILHEQPNQGRTIAEKLEHHGGAAGFTIAILTPDDVGGPDRDNLQPRARQNVVGELFWFAGKLGRPHVCALMKGKVEIPSDFAGVAFTDMDDRGAWRGEILRELAAAGYTVNWAKAMS